MIGPLALGNDESSSTWVGGNHLYLNQDSGIKSAKTNRFSIYADGKELTSGNAYANKITIKVENTIFDPTVAPADGADILNSPLITENVTFTVDKGEVTVGLEHIYLKNIYVSRYYGMQSMFTTGTHYITSDGGFSNWEKNPTSGSSKIIKTNAPYLNRFSQKNANGYYQNSIMFNKELGNHNLVNENNEIFMWSGSKTYHVLIRNKEMKKNTVVSWMGVYNWNKPIVDDENNYIYSFKENDIEYLSVTAKKEYKNALVPLPQSLINRELCSLDAVKIKIQDVSSTNMILTSNGNTSTKISSNLNEKRIKDIGIIENYDDFIDSGIYNGVYSGQTINDETNNIVCETYESFVLTTINNYPLYEILSAKGNNISHTITQFKNSVFPNGTTKYVTRVGTKTKENGITWGKWKNV